MLALDVPRFPSMAELAARLGPVDVRPVPIPADCADGFLGAWWRRPEAYLDPAVRRGISSFAQIARRQLAGGLRRLDADLRSDLGYRLVVGAR